MRFYCLFHATRSQQLFTSREFATFEELRRHVDRMLRSGSITVYRSESQPHDTELTFTVGSLSPLETRFVRADGPEWEAPFTLLDPVTGEPKNTTNFEKGGA
jgi:hypothetical protein